MNPIGTDEMTLNEAIGFEEVIGFGKDVGEGDIGQGRGWLAEVFIFLRTHAFIQSFSEIFPVHSNRSVLIFSIPLTLASQN